MKKYFCLFLMLCSVVAYSQKVKYSRAKIYLDEKEKTIIQLAKLGLAVDHGEGKKNTYFISDFSEHEISIAKENGFKVEILIEDVAAFYANQNKTQPVKKNEKNEKSMSSRDFGCNSSTQNNIITPANFQFGSMGGYFTYSEMLNILDTMSAKFPNLITSKQQIGTITSIEGRPIYWLKISDHPNQNENEPQILYTALHHAREPASLSQMIFYMYYLLENYSTNLEIKALVDNTELYFVPCVNPDGYLFNESTDPTGGGMWRKNRRNNNDGTFGVDLNRNYGKHWGYDNTGSSPSTSSDTYRGTTAFSEPETQAMKLFEESHQFKMCINYHTYGNDLIYPWSYIADFYTPDSAVYVDHCRLMTSQNHFFAGLTNQTVSYVTNGDSDDWGYGEQSTKNKIFSMTPEVGEHNEGFWPPQSSILPMCRNSLTQNIYGAELIGAYALVKDISPSTISNLNGSLKYSIQRLGLDSPAVYTVSIIPLDSWISSVGSPKIYSAMSLLQLKNDSISYSLNSAIQSGQVFSYILRVNNGLYNNDDTITKIYGQPLISYSNNCSSVSGFTSSGGNWGVSTTQFISSPSSITDSPTGNYTNNTNKTLTLNSTIDLTSAISASLNFWAKWQIEAGYDYVEVLASNDGGVSWNPLCGKYTKAGSANQDMGNPLYEGFQNFWVKEEMTLNNYIGQTIQLRFKLVSDAGANYDGFYFDDLTVSTTTSTVNIEKIDNRESFILQNIPNPANTLTNINFSFENKKNMCLKIFNSVGELIKEEKIQDKQTSLSLDVHSFSNGTYFYQIGNENYLSKMLKMVVLK